MPENAIRSIRLQCGMPLLVEPSPAAGSVALSWLLPAGSATFPDAEDGYGAMLAEFLLRGVDGMSAREHSDALDRLGVQRSLHVGTHHLQIGLVLVGDRLAEALPLAVAMVLGASLPASALEPVRSLCLQSLDALDDDPQELAMVRLKEQHLPSPINRHAYGSRDVLESCGLEDLRRAWRSRAVPNGSILAAAGRCDPDLVAARLDELLDGWSGVAPTVAAEGPGRRGTTHVEDDTAQTHLGLAWDAPAERSSSAVLERLGVRILGGDASSRLFTEVREKRGLCYSVGSSFSSGLDRGMTTVYAGSTPERAQQTVDVIMEQVRGMAHGVSESEFARAVTGLTSRLVMQGESTSARAASLAADQFRLGRPRSLAEIAAEVERVHRDDLDAWLAGRWSEEPTLVSVGPAPLQVPALPRA